MGNFKIGDRVTFHYWDNEYIGSITAINDMDMITVDVGQEKPFLLRPYDLKLVVKETTKSVYKIQDKFIEADTIEDMLQALNIEYKRYTEV